MWHAMLPRRDAMVRALSRVTSCPLAPNRMLPSLVRPLAVAEVRRGMASSSRPNAKHRVFPQWTPGAPQHELWQPNSWLGAYFKLREGDSVALRNRERLRGKKSPSRGRFIMSSLERMERDKLEAQDSWRKATWRPGDYLEVEHCAKADDVPDRVVGILLGMHRRGLGSSFRLLCYVDKVAVEYQFQLYSPLVKNVVVRQASEWRDGKRKLFRLRDQVHKLNFPKPSKPQRRVVAADTGPSLSHRKTLRGPLNAALCLAQTDDASHTCSFQPPMPYQGKSKAEAAMAIT